MHCPAEGIPEFLAPSLPLPGYPGLRIGLRAGRRVRQAWAHCPLDAVYVATQGRLGVSSVIRGNPQEDSVTVVILGLWYCAMN